MKSWWSGWKRITGGRLDWAGRQRAACYRVPAQQDEYLAACDEYRSRRRGIREATILMLIDEADRLKMAGLEQIRAIFDQGGMGLVLIGMPGMEKRLARYSQLYSRVGFVHEFSPLAETEARGLLLKGWKPPGVKLPDNALSNEEALAAILRISGGNFRLLDRLLTQISRVLEINDLQGSRLPSPKRRGKAWSLAHDKPPTRPRIAYSAATPENSNQSS